MATRGRGVFSSSAPRRVSTHPRHPLSPPALIQPRLGAASALCGRAVCFPARILRCTTTAKKTPPRLPASPPGIHNTTNNTMRMCSRAALAAVLLVVAAAQAAAASAAADVPQAAAWRRALQQDPLSNSDACLGTIPTCEPGACVARNIQGLGRYACLRCRGGYEPVTAVDGSIVQCVCPRGFYEPAGTTTCARCNLNSYCPGGDKVENPASRGGNFTCGSGLVTRNTGARSQVDCVAPAGFAMTSPTQATACAAGSYAPAFNRLGKCLRCQSGLEEPDALKLTPSQRSSRVAVCKLPPGRFMSQGLVRWCPQGFFREGFVNMDAANGTSCRPCNPGITTAGAGAANASACSVVLPGYGLSNIANNANGTAAAIPALPAANAITGLPAASLCPTGYYSVSGYCTQCPCNTTTQSRGARSAEECMVPPGYSLLTGVLAPCEAGKFRSGWAIWSQENAQACMNCGDGITSEPRDVDEHPLATNGSMVRATSASCTIDAGMGMTPLTPSGGGYAAMRCPEGSYGVAGQVFGLLPLPCKPCPRGMITQNDWSSFSADDCINPAGYGYSSEGASRCALGFYAAEGSRKPCQQCPPGRTTRDVAFVQQAFTDCIVLEGFGVTLSGKANATAAEVFGVDTSSMSLEQEASLTVLPCPVGWYGVGGFVDSPCVQCPCGTTTQASGSTNIADCNVCLPGLARAASAPADTPCTPCPIGTFSTGGETTCTSCGSSLFGAPIDGRSGGAWTSAGTTLFNGATSPDACVPWNHTLAQEAGQAYFAQDSAVLSLPTTNQSSRASLSACFGTCSSAAGKCCMVQYNANSSTCVTTTLDAVPFGSSPSTGNLLVVKLPPSELAAASKVRSLKSLTSGFYQACTIADIAAYNAWASAGSALGSDARTFTTGAAQWDSGSRAACQQKCSDSNLCWAFIFQAATNQCLYRGGVDALNTRSGFALPATGAQAPASQQCIGQQPGDGSLPGNTSCLAVGCTAGRTCLAGTCTCSTPRSTCSGACVDLRMDNNNCGACGNKCGTSSTCVNSTCVTGTAFCDRSKTEDGTVGNHTFNVIVGAVGTKVKFTFDAFDIPDRFQVFLPSGAKIYEALAGAVYKDEERFKAQGGTLGVPGAWGMKEGRDCNNVKKGNGCPLSAVCRTQPVTANGYVELMVGDATTLRVVVDGQCEKTKWSFTVGCKK